MVRYRRTLLWPIRDSPVVSASLQVIAKDEVSRISGETHFSSQFGGFYVSVTSVVEVKLFVHAESDSWVACSHQFPSAVFFGSFVARSNSSVATAAMGRLLRFALLLKGSM